MRRIDHFCFTMVILIAAFILCYASPVYSQSTVLINFGTSQSTNTFGLSGWNTALLSGNLTYTSDGPGGVCIAQNPDELSDFMGVRGTQRTFSRGERIVVTWYSTSNDTISFTARISFTDSDIPDGGAVTGSWFTMRSFNDYRVTFVRIPPHSTAQTAFNIETSGVHKTNESYALVNINLAIEWGLNDEKRWLVCDKIELMTNADIQAPSAPTGLTATPVSDSGIRLDWNASNDNTGVVEYLIYANGQIEGYTRENSYIAVLLHSATLYSFSVTALDHCRNESAHSNSATVSTLAYQGASRLIHPEAFQYLGAIRFPGEINWGGEMLGFNAMGDGGPTGNGSSDGFSGSIFTSDINTPERGYVGELSIPAPVQSSNVDDLNEATILQNFVDIRPASVNAWPYVDIWYGDLCCVPVAGSQQVALYSTWGFYYQVGGDKTASLSFCNANNLAGSAKNGAWYLGNRTQPPIDAAMNDYLFSVPDQWAATYTNGKTLVTGKSREGGLSGLGPTLYAVAPVSDASPPAVNTELPITTLLQYGSVEGTDNYHYPNSFIGYNHADWFRGAAWLSAGTQNAVMLTGNRARGNNWYGYTGERMPHDWVIADIPYPAFADTDPDGKGWRGHNKIPMIVLYDPNELAKVAQGTIPSYQPQPYAAIRLDTSIFFGPSRTIREAAYDPAQRLLFVLEHVPELDGRSVMHVWRVNIIPASIAREQPVHSFLNVYPNPFKDACMIAYMNASRGTCRIIDILGREVWSDTIVGEKRIETHAWTPGVYAVITEGNALTLIIKQ